jgi:hypothetical protein
MDHEPSTHRPRNDGDNVVTSALTTATALVCAGHTLLRAELIPGSNFGCFVFGPEALDALDRYMTTKRLLADQVAVLLRLRDVR